MKVRLYKHAGKWTVDQFTLYFPYPKWLKKQDGAEGCFVGCNQDLHGGVIKCCWDYDDRRLGYSIAGMGRRYPIEKMSIQFRKWASRLERLWNDALKYNDEKHWEIWCRA